MILGGILLGTAALAFTTPADACNCLVSGKPNCCGTLCGGTPCVCIGHC